MKEKDKIYKNCLLPRVSLTSLMWDLGKGVWDLGKAMWDLASNVRPWKRRVGS